MCECVYIYNIYGLYVYKIYIHIHTPYLLYLLMDTCCFYLGKIMLLSTLGYMYLFKLVFLFSLYIYLVVELLYHMIVLFLVFSFNSILFSILVAPI